MMKEQTRSEYGLKEAVQLWVAETIGGQEFTLFNSILVRFAGKEIQPILMDEIRELLSIDFNNIQELTAPTALGFFGLNINKASESLHFARPFLSSEEKVSARIIIRNVVQEYEILKVKLKNINGLDQIMSFITEVEHIEKSIGLTKLQDDLGKVLSNRSVD